MNAVEFEAALVRAFASLPPMPTVFYVNRRSARLIAMAQGRVLVPVTRRRGVRGRRLALVTRRARVL